METLCQQKMVAPDRVHSWALDLEAMGASAGWAKNRPDMLQREVEHIVQAFPTFLAVVGRRLSDEQCWVEAAEPLLCPSCEDLVVFDRGIRCATCQSPQEPPSESVVGFVGRIPALITGRPFAQALEQRLAELRERNDSRVAISSRSLLVAKGRQYFAPRLGLWFSQNWPHEDPPVMVWPEYFEILDIPPDHIYVADPYYRLCLYANWHEQPACAVLQKRVVPRLLIDLMLADLNALGKLDEALTRLDASLYDVYNMVGNAEKGEKLRQVHADLIEQICGENR